MQQFLDVAWLFAAILFQPAIGASSISNTSISNDAMMPPILSCPDPVPAEGSTCESPFSCEVGKFCCPEDDSICVPAKACYCDDATSVVMCYDTFYQIICPSMCPTTRPETNDDCSLDNRFVCNYGNPLDCKDVDIKYEFERQCSCYDGKFICYDNNCPVPCPAAQPQDGEKCLPFAPDNCEYGSLCCPGDDGECVPDKSCYCDGTSSYCYDAYFTLPCPSVCPKIPPNNMDSCDLDSRFQCNYGDALTCEYYYDANGVLSYFFEKQCTCYNGTFTCDSHACPEPCPEVEPLPGSACSPFVTFNCGYDEYCCDGADSGNCVAMTECYCGSDLTSTCYEPSINCPSKCPEIKPENGQSCDMEQRLTCRYNEGMCPTSECNCVQGVYVCNEFCYDIGYDENSNNGGVTEDAKDPIQDIPSSDADDKHKRKKNKKKDKKGKSRTEKVEKKGKKGKKGKKLEKFRK